MIEHVHTFAGDVVVAEIVIERELHDSAMVDQSGRRVRGRHVHPPGRRRAIVEQVIEPNPELAARDFRLDRPLVHRVILLHGPG